MEVQNRVFKALKYYEFNNDLIDFVTLTNVPDNDKNFIACFEDLVKYIESVNSGFKFFVVYTLEGYGVCHCIFINCPFNKDKLCSLWNGMTGSYIIDKQRFKEGTESKLGCYLNNQKEYLRYDCSLDFFVDDFEIIGNFGVTYEKVE